MLLFTSEMNLYPSSFLQVWSEERLSEANEKGTLVVLENMDPSFTSGEVEVIHSWVFLSNLLLTFSVYVEIGPFLGKKIG